MVATCLHSLRVKLSDACLNVSTPWYTRKKTAPPQNLWVETSILGEIAIQVLKGLEWFRRRIPALSLREWRLRATIYQKNKTGMQLKTILNHVQKFKSFVYTAIRWATDAGESVLEVDVQPRVNSS